MTRLFPVLTLIVAACGDSNPPPVAPAPADPPSVAPNPDATARYIVTFESTWSAGTHPNMFPPNPHFSGLIGATHRTGFRLWAIDAIASNGIEAMAEEGSKTPLDMEIQRAIDDGDAEILLSGDGIDLSPDSVSLELEVSLEYPAVDLVSMLAPSPDWFVGVSDLSLLENGDWVQELVVELHAYDAGTDSGVTYAARDRDTVPREPIARLDGPPLASNGTVPPVGTFTFRRQ